MSAVQSAFMKEQMAYMMREMESEFSGDNEDQNTVGPEIYNVGMSATREQSLSADFNRLSIEERVSSSSGSALIHGSSESSTAVKGNKSSRHIIIPGDHIELDNNIYYQCDFDSHKKTNSIIENSFGEGEQEASYRCVANDYLCFLNKILPL